MSDDGVRVSVDGKPVIENWAWHGPTRDTGKLTLSTDKTVEIVVEHFQIDGYAVLEFSLRQRWSPFRCAAARLFHGEYPPLSSGSTAAMRGNFGGTNRPGCAFESVAEVH